MADLCGYPTTCNRKAGHRGPHGGWQTEKRPAPPPKEPA